MIFMTSDTHFSHFNIMKYCHRPFQTVEEMNSTIIERWNSVVKDGDTIYHLGDFGWGSPDSLRLILKQLKGIVILIRGNHDRNIRNEKMFVKECDILEIKIDDIKITLHHYAQRVWNCSHYGAFHLYGHSHGTLPDYGFSFDVGVDAQNFTPISFDQVKEKMVKKGWTPDWKSVPDRNGT